MSYAYDYKIKSEFLNTMQKSDKRDKARSPELYRINPQEPGCLASFTG